MGGVETRLITRTIAVLAACVGAVACGSDGDGGGEATAPPGTTGPPPSSAPVETAPATNPPESTAPSVTPPDDVDEPVVTDVGWDGAGSACVALGPNSTGCFPGGMLTAQARVASVRTDGTDWSVEVTLDAGEVTATATPGSPACDGDVDAPPDAWLVGLACGQGGAALWSALPDRPGGDVRHEAVRGATGDVVALMPLSLDGDVRVLTADVDLEGVAVRCTLVVPPTDGWFESCDVPSPAHPGTRLVVHDGDAHLVDPADGRVVALGDAPLRTNGCDHAVMDIAAELDDVVMLGNLACRDGVATGAYGSVFVQQGPVDGSLVILERDDDGTWALVDSGTGIDTDPLPLPLPSLDVAELDATPNTMALEDVTETIRGWMTARPELTIAEAIAAGEADVTSVETLPTTAMAPLPSLTVVDVSYPDDSVTGARYAVWTTEPDDGSHPLLVAYRWNLCGRGVTDDGLCV